MTPRDPGLAAAAVSLAAEAALLEARARMLQETLDTVDGRIEELSEKLRTLRARAAAPQGGATGDDAEVPAGATGSASSPGRGARAAPRP